MVFGKKSGDKDSESANADEQTARDADFSALDENNGIESAATDPAVTETIDSVDNDEIRRLREELRESQDKNLRLLAEFENYKKRTIKERADLLKYQGERIFVDVIEILDNLELAVQHKDADPEKLRSGIELIHKLFQDVLARWEVRGESSVGKDFDPQKHNAISRVEVDDAKPGSVISELKRVYVYKDKVIRVGEVVVAAAREAGSDETESE